MELDEALEMLSACTQGPAESAARQLAAAAKSQELRDLDELDAPEFTRPVAAALSSALQQVAPEDDAFVGHMLELAQRLDAFPEFSDAAAALAFDANVGVAALDRIEMLGAEADPTLRWLAHRSYQAGDANTRARLRHTMGAVLSRAATSHDRRAFEAAAKVLPLVEALVRGFEAPLSSADKALFNSVILPLHTVQGKISPTEPAIGLFHKELVQCVSAFVDKQPALVTSACQFLIKFWPTQWDGNSPKEVLFLHELEALLDHEDFAKVIDDELVLQITKRLRVCLASDNSTVCERALMFWRNEEATNNLLRHSATSNEVVYNTAQPLLAHALTHWNKTVTVMAAHVVRKLLSDYESIVLSVAQESFLSKRDPEGHLYALLSAIEAADERKAKAAEKHTAQSTSVPAKQDTTFMNMILAEELGDGSFAQVFRALKVVPGQPRSAWPEYALKRIDAKHRELAMREVEVMDKLLHPNCTRLIGMYESAGSINLVLEYAALGDLHTCLQRMGTLDHASVAFVGAEVASALGAVHAEGYIYGDLKPENILVHANGHVKLGDFGATRAMSRVASGDDPLEGTWCYLAPELFRPRDAAESDDNGDLLSAPEAIDWWAYGCLLYQLLTGRPPLWVEEERELVQHLVSFKIERYPAGFPEVGKSIVDALLLQDPLQRLGSNGGVAAVEAHPFFENLGFPFSEAHSQAAPKFAQGEVKAQTGPWSQRSYSMMHAPLPERYDLSGSTVLLDPIEEAGERGAPWRPSNPGLPKLVRLVAGSSGAVAGKSMQPAPNAKGAMPGAGSALGLATAMPKGPTIVGRGTRGTGGAARAASRPTGRGGQYTFNGMDLSAG